MLVVLCLLVVLVIGWLVRGQGPKRVNCVRSSVAAVAPAPKNRRGVSWAPLANYRTVDIESPVGETGTGMPGWIDDVVITV